MPSSSTPRWHLCVRFFALLLLTSCGSNSTAVVGDPASVELSADSVSFASLNATTDLNAIARDAGGTVLTASFSWSTGSSSVATVDNQGVVTAVGNGTTNVVAAAGSFADTAVVTVQQVAATLTLSPDTLRLAAPSDTATIGRTVRDAGGSAMTGVAVTFATVDPAVATVGVATGKVTAQANGATNITAQVAPGGAALTKSIRVEVGGSLPASYLVGGYVGVAYAGDQVGPATGAGGAFTYSVTAGALPNGLSINGSNGQITGTPTASGAFFFEVRATNGTLTLSERYAITISTKPAGAFNLWVSYNGGPMPHANVQTAVTNALDRWEEIITGDAGAPVTYPPNAFSPGGSLAGACSNLINGTLYNSAFIEDVAIIVALAPIDGGFNTLAQGGPCGSTRPQRPVIISGQMKLDAADFTGAANTTFMQDVILHEIGHVLGVGTLWQDSTVFAGTDSTRYFGQNGKAQWIALGGANNVPLEPNIGAHWHEGYFNAELMTPAAEGAGASHPISRLTIGALLDLGWTASLVAADPYTLPGCSPTCMASPARTAGESAPFDEVIIEPLTPLPPGALGRQ